MGHALQAETPETAGVGHNSGKVPSPEIIREVLKEEQEKALKRADALMVSFSRVPEKIDDDGTSENATEFVRQLAACVTALEAARTESKKPYLDGGRAVDAFFKPVTDKLDAAKKTVNKRIGQYLAAKEAREQAEAAAREAEARAAEQKAREEAAAAAAAAKTDEEKAAALAKEREAEEAAQAAQEAAATAPTGQIVRGAYGGTSSLRKEWKGEIEDITKIPLETLRPYFSDEAIEKAVRAFVKEGGRELPGVRIFQDATAVTR